MRLRSLTMVQAVGILSVLQILTEGVLGEGAPYGVSRQVVEGAARAGAALSADGRPRSRQLDNGPIPPALSQLATPEFDNIANSTESSTQTTSDYGDGKQDNPSEDLEVAIVVVTEPPSSMPVCELSNRASGEVRYEKILDSKLEPSANTADVIRRNDMPETVLALCRNRCVNDKTAEQQFRRTCTAFDFIPGKRITRYSNSIEYTESKCLLSQTENQRGEPRYLKEKDHLHYREVCYSAVRVKQQCPNRLSVMERIRNHEFQPKDAKLVPSNSREDCQDKCLNQLTDDPINSTNVCRSGTWDNVQRRCYLSGFTRRTHPHEMKENSNFDYFENTCLSNELRCPKNKLVFVKQNNVELGGTYDTAIYQGLNLTQCQDKCLGSPTLFCRSLEYDEQSKNCVLSEEDTTSKADELRDSTSQKSVYYELICIDGAKIHGDYQFVKSDNQEKQQLNDRQYRDVRTAFQLFRNRRLELTSGFTGSRGRDRDRMTLAECLDECLEERSFTCRSVMYSDRYQTCKLSEYDQLNGKTVYDGEYDYYENLIENQMIHQATSGSEENVIVTGEDGNRDIGPGSAGQTGVFRPPPPSFDRNANVNRNGNGNGGFLASSGFENNGQRVSSDRFDAFNAKTSTVTDSNLRSNGNDRSSNTGGFLASSGFDRNRGSSSSFDRDSNRDSGRLGDDRFRPLGGGGSSSFNNIDSNGIGSNGNRPDRNGNRPDRNPISFGGTRPSTASQVSGSGSATKVGDDIQVTQQCTDDGMEFILTTNDVFRGRIYTYGYYDRCYVRGSGGTTTNLRISGERGRPECGTIKYGETSSNIVVVQFSDNVQTSLDKRYNLTCTITGPGEAVVTSGYIGASNGAPTPIEYLPAENQLQSRVRLQILYGGRPTTTIAVGDPLTFRLEAQSGRQTISDIFATNVVAKDPYTGREVKLIDNRGCPIDNHVFPGLGQARDGDGLEARFNAFKIPESNFLLFEATVKSCRRGCEPAFCTSNNGREELPSYGRRKRAAEDDPLDDGEEDENAEIYGIYEVYLNREDIHEPAASIELQDELCLAPSEYYGLVATIAILIVFLLAALLAVAYCSRRSRHQDLNEKNSMADAGSPFGGQSSSQASQFPGAHPRTLTEPASYFPNNEDASPAQCDAGGQGRKGRFQDPSEPIFTNPALFER